MLITGNYKNKAAPASISEKLFQTCAPRLI